MPLCVMLRGLCLAAICLLAACAQQGPLFRLQAATETVATVYVYRPAQGYDASNYEDSYLYMGEHQLAKLELGTYAVFELSPGYHELEIKDGVFFSFPGITHSTLALNVQGGQRYFIELRKQLKDFTTVEGTQLNSNQTMLEMVPEQDALPVIATTHLWHRPE